MSMEIKSLDVGVSRRTNRQCVVGLNVDAGGIIFAADDSPSRILDILTSKDCLMTRP